MNDGEFYVGHAATENHAKVFESRGIKRTEMVETIKARAAVLLAEIDAISIPPDNKEAGRLVALAKTDLESCVMWAVKALSRN
jgi:hypothetical protein